MNILSNRGKLKWCVREKSINDIDNGWRFFSDIDSEEYLINPDNMSICGFNTMDINQSSQVLQQQVFELQNNLRTLQQSGLPLYGGKGQGATLDSWQRSLERIK